MTKVKSEELFNLSSEDIEPAFARMIGVMFKRFEYIRDNPDKTYESIGEASANFWNIVNCMSLMNGILRNVPHCSIATNNNQQAISKMIEDATGMCPILEREKYPSIVYPDPQVYHNWYQLERIKK